MLIPFSEVEPYLRAPGASSVPLTACGVNGSKHLAATDPAHGEPVGFPVVGGQPVLVDFRKSLLTRERFEHTQGASLVTRGSQRPRALKGKLAGTANVSARNIERFRSLLPNGTPLLLMIGAATPGIGTDVLVRGSRDPSDRVRHLSVRPDALRRRRARHSAGRCLCGRRVHPGRARARRRIQPRSSPKSSAS